MINADEEIFEMSNGCICCTVRGDLIRVLGNPNEAADKFDYVLVETTGLADPGPVAQTFFMDDELGKFTLDGIVTWWTQRTSSSSSVEATRALSKSHLRCTGSK